MGLHSRFAPSATEREYLCPPSFLLNEQAPDVQTFDAAHGTAAHFIGDLCGKHDHDVEFYVGCTVAVTARGACRFVHENAPLNDGSDGFGDEEMGFEVDDEMVVAVQEYLDRCREIPGDHFWEVRVEHTPWCPDVDENGEPLGPQYGTSDHVVCQPGVLTVTDLKYGKGVMVFAKENKQAIKYALGVWLEYNWIYKFKKVVIRIAQPRLGHFDVWEVDVATLLWWGKHLKEKLTQVFDPSAEFNPGEKQCKFCKVAARCRPLAEYVHSNRALGFEDEGQGTYTDVSLLTNEELESAWRMRPMLVIRFDAIKRELLRTIIQGEVHESLGVKVVASVTHRRWKDEGEVKRTLLQLGVPKSKFIKEKLASPNQIEQMLPKTDHEKIAELWEKPQGGPAIVDVSDKREPFGGALSHGGFEDETHDDGFGE